MQPALGSQDYLQQRANFKHESLRNKLMLSTFSIHEHDHVNKSKILVSALLNKLRAHRSGLSHGLPAAERWIALQYRPEQLPTLFLWGGSLLEMHSDSDRPKTLV